MYVRRTSAAKATNDSGTSIQGRNAAASCKPIYTVIHLRRTICVSKEAMERLPRSNPEGSLMACPQPYRSLMMPAQHFEPGDFTFRNRLAESHLRQLDAARNEKRNRMNPSSITLNKAGISAMPLQLQRRAPSLIVKEQSIYIYIFLYVYFDL
ncbi:Hypothetical_protein [Hexamita inflata]|uniref:Hypothetical_protein n=1 Tax=Hexamita inflata TaxID=28002 RepID=A0AA86NW14_9EUKA|nr:Hypothetical protein HINF_LOCUS13376 [Hexamita inflata]